MDKELKKIIVSSTFSVADGSYVYAQVSELPEKSSDHFMVTTDKDEITVVTKSENLKDLELIERNKDNYKLFALNVSVPFYSVGFLAAISEAIAKENINVLIVSTYSKDYILIEESSANRVGEILVEMGMRQGE